VIPSRPLPDAVVAELHVVPPDASLVLVGDVDLHVAEQVSRALEAVAASTALHLTVDLGPTGFVSLGVLGELVSVGRTLAERGGGLRLSGARPVQRRVLDLLELPPGMVLVNGIDG
jgi:anti-anti-sigma regulatory factor